MLKTKVYEITKDGVVEHEMYTVDAREAVKNDPERWTLEKPAKGGAKKD